jgi:maltose/moltooligosaccharide transporter
VVALLADVVPDAARSRANGLIAAMAGPASLVAFFVGPALHAVFAPLPFVVVSGALVAVSVVLVRVVHEPAVVAAPSQPSLRRVLAALRHLGEPPRRPVALVLLGAFAWTGAQTSVESLFVTYAVYRLHVSSGAAVVSVGVFALAYLAAAVPAGFLGHRLGRRWTVVLGLVIAGASFGVVAGVHQLAVVRGVAAIAGVGWALANVSAYPLLVGLVGANDTSLATGLWLLATGVGGAVLEPLIGLAMDVLGYAWLLIAAALLFGVGAVAVALARRRGEEPVSLVVGA